MIEECPVKDTDQERLGERLYESRGSQPVPIFIGIRFCEEQGVKSPLLTRLVAVFFSELEVVNKKFKLPFQQSLLHNLHYIVFVITAYRQRLVSNFNFITFYGIYS